MAVTVIGASVRESRNSMPINVPSGDAVAEQTPSGLQPWSTGHHACAEFHGVFLAHTVLARLQTQCPTCGT